MTPEQEERMVAAFERLADAFYDWYLKQYPKPREVTDATITHIKTQEEQILEDQGYERGELGRWLDIGPRERAFEKTTESTGIPSSSVTGSTGKTRN